MNAPLRLTAEQEAAVTAIGRPCLVTAPPGSGKTEVLVQRVLRVLTRSEDSTTQVLALTFTNKAAESLRARILDEIGDEHWRLFAGTFHSFCFDILKNYGSRVGIPSTFSILEDDDARIDTLLRGLDSGTTSLTGLQRPDLLAFLEKIDRLRSDLVGVEVTPATPQGPHRIPMNEIYGAYEGQMAADASLDFPGILFHAHQILATDEWVLSHYRTAYSHIVVDEAQDLNLAQYRIIKLLSDNDRDVMLVADRFQSIYAFTGASPRYLDEFRADFDVLELGLTTNFRSASTIVGIANSLARHFSSKAVAPTPMTASLAATGSVLAEEHPNEQAEASAVCSWFERLLNTGLDPAWLHEGEDERVQPESCCVLARTRFALEPVTAALEKRGLAYALRTGDRSLFDSLLGQAVYYSLRAIANPSDVATRRRVLKLLGAPTTGGEHGPVSTLLALLESHGLPTAIADRLVSLAESRSTLQEVVVNICQVEIAGFDTADSEAAAEWGGDQDRLGEWWRRFVIATPPHGRTVDGFMRYLVQAQRTVLDEPGIRLLTVHTAKGLEFRAVAVVGLNDGTFPHYLSIRSEEELDEERRNAYVAVTRAARALYLTRSAVRATRYGPRVDPPSRFLDEMGVVMMPASAT